MRRYNKPTAGWLAALSVNIQFQVCLTAPRTRFAWRLCSFVTNPREQCGLKEFQKASARTAVEGGATRGDGARRTCSPAPEGPRTNDKERER